MFNSSRGKTKIKESEIDECINDPWDESELKVVRFKFKIKVLQNICFTKHRRFKFCYTPRVKDR